MAVEVNYWKCSKERYEQYKKANKIVKTDFYLVSDKENNTETLYLGLIPLSNNNVVTYDIFTDPFTTVIFDGGGADIVLAILDDTILE